MELQEPVLRGLSGLLTWTATPRYPDVRGALAERLLEVIDGLDDWTFEGPMTLVGNEERGLHVFVEAGHCLALSEDPEDGRAAVTLASCFEAVIDTLEPRELRASGARSTWLSAASSDSELVGWLEDRLGLGESRKLFDPFGGKPSSLRLMASFGASPSDWDVEIRPMSAAEAAEGGDFIVDDESNYPPASLFVEVSRDRLISGLAAGEIVEQWRTDVERNIDAARKFHRLLTGQAK